MYGLLISLSILTCILIAEYIVKKDNKNTDIIWNLGSILIVSGIIGARIYHVIDYWEYYSKNILNIFYIWQGGLGIYGGIFLGFLSSYIYLRVKRVNIRYYISIITVVLPLGQSIGRLGNYFNKELYGKQTTLPWGIMLEGNRYHPLFFYESILSLILFIILIYLKLKRNTNSKRLIGVYLGGYGIIRFLLEYLRINPWEIYGLNVAQVISIIFLGIAFLLILKKDTNDIYSK